PEIFLHGNSSEFRLAVVEDFLYDWKKGWLPSGHLPQEDRNEVVRIAHPEMKCRQALLGAQYCDGSWYRGRSGQRASCGVQEKQHPERVRIKQQIVVSCNGHS